MSTKDFQFMEKLGQGAYSSVYKVKRHADSQIYALKKVKMNNLSSKEQQNALNEVRLLASTQSPYIVGYKHSFIENNSLYIIMDFSDDGDLYQKIVQHQKSRTEFSEETIWKTLIQVVAGLKTLHQNNILHRDLKSANVFLSKNGIAKLGDMNVSKIAKNGLLYTQTGTPYYASPEVWKDKPYDSKSDIWSLGCVIYEMVTLKPPFRAEDMDGLYKKVIKGAYQKIGDQFSKSLGSVIKSMLQVNPSSRPSAEQLLKNLSGKAEEYGVQIEEEEVTPNKQLLQTIRAHKNLHYLTDRLPKSNYQNGHQYEKHPKMSQSTKAKTQKPSLIGVTKNINLPKLDRIVRNSGSHKPTLNNYEKSEKKYLNPDMGSILKIQGKNSNPRYDYKYDQSKDIKAELRKIYHIKPSPIRNREKEYKPVKRTIIKQLPGLPRIH